MLDPALGTEIVTNFWRKSLDYCSNLIPATHPDGLVVEVVSFAALERSWNEADLPSDREHVTTYIRTHLDDFNAENIAAERDYSDVRWTVDRPEDLEVVRRIFALIDARPNEFLDWRSVLRLVSEHPEISTLNAHYRRYEGWDRSIQAEGV